jgi:hypothetical protein
MPDKQRKQVVWLATLLAALAVVLAWQFWPGAGSAPGAGPSGRTTAPASRTRGRPPGEPGTVAPPPHVNLEALDARRVDTPGAPRNPFQMHAAPPPPTPTAPPRIAPPAPADGTVTPAPDVAPPPPPISLKFIGTVAPSSVPAGKIAVLSDGKFVFYGREGDIIEGRYRLVKIGEESLQIEYVDGRGRQTLRLSGS